MEDRRRRQNALLSKLRKITRTGVSTTPSSSSTTTNSDGPLVEKNVAKSGDGCEENDGDVQLVEDYEKRKMQEELRRKAAEALIREAKRSAQRAQLYGPQGWIKPRALSTNKVFLARTLQSVEIQRRDQQQKGTAVKRTPKVMDQTERQQKQNTTKNREIL